jgi:hypothetical protein
MVAAGPCATGAVVCVAQPVARIQSTKAETDLARLKPDVIRQSLIVNASPQKICRQPTQAAVIKE